MAEKINRSFNESQYYSLKYKNYFPIYEKLFDKFRDKKLLCRDRCFIWWLIENVEKIFWEGSRIIGIDLNPKAKNFEDDEIEIFIGSRIWPKFLGKFFKKVGKVDIILDDGGHTNFQQIMTTCCAVPNINDDGLLVVETCFIVTVLVIELDF